MPLFEFEGQRPRVDPKAWVAPTATIIGDVTLGPGVSVWFGAVLRGDVGPIHIERDSNIQDNSVLHVKTGSFLRLGERVTIAHGCVVHGREIGSGSLIGNGATLLDESAVGEGVLVAAGSVVTPGTHLPPHTLVRGVPAKVVGEIAEGSEPARILATNADVYLRLADRHRRSLRDIDLA